jgi:hypothetical protein
MTTIKLGPLAKHGDASKHLLSCLSGKEFPLAGIAETPYIPGEEILEGFANRLHDPKICYLIEKSQVLKALSKISPKATAEIREKYKRLFYLPVGFRSCEIIT